jgi:hypothetical protein
MARWQEGVLDAKTSRGSNQTGLCEKRMQLPPGPPPPEHDLRNALTDLANASQKAFNCCVAASQFCFRWTATNLGFRL